MEEKIIKIHKKLLKLTKFLTIFLESEAGYIIIFPQIPYSFAHENVYQSEEDYIHTFPQIDQIPYNFPHTFELYQITLKFVPNEKGYIHNISSN